MMNRRAEKYLEKLYKQLEAIDDLVKSEDFNKTMAVVKADEESISAMINAIEHAQEMLMELDRSIDEYD